MAIHPEGAIGVPAVQSSAGSGTAVQERTQERLGVDQPWSVVVWDDPVNLMSYVAYVFRSHFGYSAATAHRLMLQVHENGRAVVARGDRESAERHVSALHGFGLWATLETQEG